jgi:hypothetical protein
MSDATTNSGIKVATIASTISMAISKIPGTRRAPVASSVAVATGCPVASAY